MDVKNESVGCIEYGIVFFVIIIDWYELVVCLVYGWGVSMDFLIIR